MPMITACGSSEGTPPTSTTLATTMAGSETVIHLASNPDIARAVTEPAIDFDAGTLLTHHVVEAMRRSGAHRILYASGSGVYGDIGELEADEDHGPLVPISTYGASKLAGEALISAYCSMFDLTGCVFRFGNVVGPRQTHGVGFDFICRLLEDPDRLRILGDGRQSKSYVHVSDVVEAVLLAAEAAPRPIATYNVATGDYITVSEIARASGRGARIRAGPYSVRVHRRRPWLEGRCARRQAEHQSHPPSRLGQFHVDRPGTALVA